MAVGSIYWLTIYPRVRRELSHWERLARRIPDPILRGQALDKLTRERLNPEAAALFAVLAPRSQRRQVVRLIVAYQVLYDFLDAVNEEPGCGALRNGLQLHRALSDALLPEQRLSDYYRHHPRSADGGYMLALTCTCRRIVQRMPSLGHSAGVIARATERCAQGQSHNHAILGRGYLRLIEWSRAQAPGGCEYHWWELAAGGISCLSVHALLAAGAHPRTRAAEVAELDAAYFPSICALSALLDSLADHDGDEGTDNHSFVSHYRDATHAAERLVAITAEAAGRVGATRQARRHGVILAGIAAFYLSSPSVRTGFPVAAADRLIAHLGPIGAVMRAVMQLRRRLHRGRATAANAYAGSCRASAGDTRDAT